MHDREAVYQMLQAAIRTQQDWREAYDIAKASKQRSDALYAARNHKALEGVIKTLRWVLNYPGITSPLD
jgi:hypothetical protein